MRFKAAKAVVPLALVVGMAGAGLTACDPPATTTPGGYTVYENLHAAPTYPLQHSWSPAIPIEAGVANSCITATQTEVANRSHFCRVVDGYEETGDHRDWTIIWASRTSPTLAYTKGSIYGEQIVLGGGQMYEGCTYNDPGNVMPWYDCDYRIRKPVVFSTDSSNSLHWGLMKLWNWSQYAANEGVCAFGVRSLWAGLKITVGLIGDCIAQPFEG